MRKLLIFTSVVACMAAIAFIQALNGLSVGRSTAVLCAGLSCCFYISYRLSGNPWLRRVAIALLPTAGIMWLINSQLWSANP